MTAPAPQYGEWTRGNTGQVGRTVTRWVPGLFGGDWMPVVDWEPHPDESVLPDEPVLPADGEQ